MNIKHVAFIFYNLHPYLGKKVKDGDFINTVGTESIKSIVEEMN